MTRVTDNYVFFWKGNLSNFAYSPFIDESGTEFFCVEQYFMYKKAITFNDQEIAKRILETNLPWIAKSLGRKVKNFDNKTWDSVKEKIMYEGNLMKYEQNPKFKKLLLSPRFKGRKFVEASPFDNIWGIGLDMNDPSCNDEKDWKGQNLLGKVLDKVREKLES